MNNLKDLYLIQKALQEAHYFDISRISQEIIDFIPKTDFPLEQVLKRIKNNEPWEYIRGKAEFRNNLFEVNSSTLIPRIETEHIVDIAKKEIKKTSYTDIVDIGTGSGCIIISLIKELENNSMVYHATDISLKALAIAKLNEKNILRKKIIHFSKTNLIENLNFFNTSNVLFIANLPYIPTDMYNKLDKSVKDFEPRTALEGGIDGLEYYKELFEQIKGKNIKGTIIFEIEPSTIDSLLYLKPEVFTDQYNQKRFLLTRFS